MVRGCESGIGRPAPGCPAKEDDVKDMLTRHGIVDAIDSDAPLVRLLSSD